MGGGWCGWGVLGCVFTVSWVLSSRHKSVLRHASRVVGAWREEWLGAGQRIYGDAQRMVVLAAHMAGEHAAVPVCVVPSSNDLCAHSDDLRLMFLYSGGGVGPSLLLSVRDGGVSGGSERVFSWWCHPRLGFTVHDLEATYENLREMESVVRNGHCCVDSAASLAASFLDNELL